MKIIIANQKGGAGKTTHCVLLANYLVLEKKQELLVLDLDFQGTLKGLWDTDQQHFDNQPLYEVIAVDLQNAPSLMQQISQVEGHVIIDLPGKMDDDQLVPVFQSADLVLVPFAYDKISFESTYTFAQVVKHLNDKVEMAFIPNRLKAGVKYETKAQVNEVLEKIGSVAPAISDKVAFQRIDTLSIARDIQQQVAETYEFIYAKYLEKSWVT